MNALDISTLLVIAGCNGAQAGALDILDTLAAEPEDNLKHVPDRLQPEETLPQALPFASPERSSVDEEHFNMAASYLKSQFSIPHHLVPSYQDTASLERVRWSAGAPDFAEERIRRLPNIQNHQLDSWSDSSSSYDYEYIDTSNEFQQEEDKRYKRKPDLDYTWAQEQRPGGAGQEAYRKGKPKSRKVATTTKKPQRTHKRPKQRPKPLKNMQRFPRNPAQFQNFVPQQIRSVPQNMNFLAAMTSQLRNRLSSAFTGNRRATFPLGVQPGYLRRPMPGRRTQPKVALFDYEDYYDTWVPENTVPDIPGNRLHGLVPDIPGNRLGTRGRTHSQQAAPASRPREGFFPVNLSERQHPTRAQQKRLGGGKKRREQNKNKRKKRRKAGQKSTNLQESKASSKKRENINTNRSDWLVHTRRNDLGETEKSNEKTVQSFDGLDMDFWEEDVEQATKPDYRRRWQDLKKPNQNDNENVEKHEMITEDAPVGSRRSIEPNNENEQEQTNEENDSSFQDLSTSNDGARYLSAWADAGVIMDFKEKETEFSNEESLTAAHSEDLDFKPSIPYEEKTKEGRDFSENEKIGWGEKMWEEVKDDWKKDSEKWQKHRVRKRKKENEKEVLPVKKEVVNQKAKAEHSSYSQDMIASPAVPGKAVKPLKRRPTRRSRTRRIQDLAFRHS